MLSCMIMTVSKWKKLRRIFQTGFNKTSFESDITKWADLWPIFL